MEQAGPTGPACSIGAAVIFPELADCRDQGIPPAIHGEKSVANPFPIG